MQQKNIFTILLVSYFAVPHSRRVWMIMNQRQYILLWEL